MEPDLKLVNARRIIPGMSSTRLIVPFHLTKLSKMLDGTSCWILPAHASQRVLAHQQQDGDVVGEGAGDTGQGIGCPGARAGQGHAHFAGSPCVTVGDFNAETLVPG